VEQGFTVLPYLHKELNPSWEAANCEAIQEIRSNFIVLRTWYYYQADKFGIFL
jgi:hypothetical protein